MRALTRAFLLVLTLVSVPAGAAESRATIVLVARAGQSTELVLLLGELLGRQGVACEFSRARRFEPDALFRETEDDHALRMFVVVAEPGRARLYFRGPGGERFLLRKLTLPDGLGEVGRELIGQVVESSTVALLRSSTGLNREQASAEVARDTAASKPTPTRTKPTRSEGRSLELSGTLRYAAFWSGPDLGLSHGPGLELGVGWRPGLLLRGRLTAEWHFAQTLSSKEIEAHVQTTSLRASVDLGLPLTLEQMGVLALGAGLDIARIEPGVPRTRDVTPSAPATHLIPVLRPELRYELSLGRLLVVASTLVDLSLLDTHYDLSEAGRKHRIGAPWRARPGVGLAFGGRW